MCVVNCRPTVGQMVADSRPTVDQQSADSFLGELFFPFPKSEPKTAISLLYLSFTSSFSANDSGANEFK